MAKQKKNGLSTANWIVKSNTLNEMRYTQMTPSQQRLFLIYLSKINPQDETTRVVEFKLNEYARIMQFKQANVTRLIEAAKKLVSLTITVVDKNEENGLSEFVTCSLFKHFKLRKDENSEWIVSIDCNDDVVKLMFDLKKYFFKYKLWNVLQLASPNQQRMYELMKQYENAGAREISVKDLREFLGLKPKEYQVWQNFKVRILEASQVALQNSTDIKFTWEVAGKRGAGGKINTLKFNIEKNVIATSQITFEEYLSAQDQPVIIGEPKEFEQTCENDNLSFLSEACDNEFKREEIQVLHNLILEIVPIRAESWKGYDTRQFDYLKRKYDELNMRAERAEIKSRFGYLKKIVEADLQGAEA